MTRFHRALSRLESDVCSLGKHANQTAWRHSVGDALLSVIEEWEENHENREKIWRRMSETDHESGKKYGHMVRCELTLLADCHRFRKAVLRARDVEPLQDALLSWIAACRAVEKILDASLLEFHRTQASSEAV